MASSRQSQTNFTGIVRDKLEGKSIKSSKDVLRELEGFLSFAVENEIESTTQIKQRLDIALEELYGREISQKLGRNISVARIESINTDVDVDISSQLRAQAAKQATRGFPRF